MTPAEAAQAVAILLAAFPGAPTTPGTAPLYERKLAPLDKDRCARAIDRLIETWLYPRSLPAVGNILEVYAELTRRDKRREELERQVAEDRAYMERRLNSSNPMHQMLAGPEEGQRIIEAHTWGNRTPETAELDEAIESARRKR